MSTAQLFPLHPFVRISAFITFKVMAEVKPKLRRVVTFTKSNHRWSTTFDETDSRQGEEPKSKDNEKAEVHNQEVSDNESKNILFKRSQTIS
ncbi:unnamed protein product [Litomosoides sigmodontis]|uniref:Uncharacterized protein n=1 Tax=Litomosoides sigmodontis TaxID=42156 RepID=A0A3P6TNL0_LITSI|nr:unnamed protein product [Litomosoides sigmodontis]